MHDYENLNYSALDDKSIRSKDFTQERLIASGLSKQRNNVLTAVAILILAIVLALHALLLISDGWSLLAALPIIALLSVFLARSLNLEVRRRFRVLKFALDNNLHYIAEKAPATRAPIMFDIGHSKIQSDILIFPNQSFCARYSYTVGSGKNQSTYHLFFMRVKLSRKVPHLILNGKKNGVKLSPAGHHVQELKLEGDFGKYFRLFIPPNYHIDALQIFTPDVMQTLIDIGQQLDIELVGDELYVYQSLSNNPYKSSNDMRNFLATVSLIAAQFDKQVKTYSDTRAGSVASGRVHQSGTLVKKRINKYLRIVVIIIVLLITFAIPIIIRLAAVNYFEQMRSEYQVPQDPTSRCLDEYRLHDNFDIFQQCMIESR